MSTCARVCSALLVGAFVAACSGDNAPAVRAISATRVLDADQAPRFDAGPAERFGFSGATARSGAHGASGSGAMGAASGSTPRAPVDFDLPEGWREVAPTSMRALNFAVGDGGECYLTSLPGTAGGLLANVNRWRGQMGHAPLTLAEAEALPRHPLLGADAWSVDLRGRFTGMDGRPAEGEQRLLGLLHVSPAGSLFLKAVGPAEVWEHEADAFLALAASMRPRATASSHAHGAGHDHAAHGDDGHDHSAHAAGDGHDHADHAAGDGHDHDHAAHADAHGAASAPEGGAPTTGPATGAGPLRWALPASWDVAPPSPMSLAVFTARTAPDVRVSVSLLPGDAGGLRANLDRWAGQVGASTLSDAELAELPRVPLLGELAPLLARAGAFAGMGADPLDDALLLGVVHPLGARTLFVKLVGPRAAAAAERGAFLAFCASLRSVDDG